MADATSTVIHRHAYDALFKWAFFLFLIHLIFTFFPYKRAFHCHTSHSSVHCSFTPTTTTSVNRKGTFCIKNIIINIFTVRGEIILAFYIRKYFSLLPFSPLCTNSRFSMKMVRKWERKKGTHPHYVCRVWKEREREENEKNTNQWSKMMA